jgi:hypothetical protein
MQATTPTRTDIRLVQYRALSRAIIATAAVSNDLDDAGLYTDAATMTTATQQLYNTQAKVAMLLQRTGDLNLVKDDGR